MAQPTQRMKKPEPVTLGTRLGTRLRARANLLSDAEREAARQRGMQLIYGDASSRKVQAHRR